MKKYICFIILDLSLSIVPAHATTAWTSSECNTEKGGEIVEVGGDSFCKSTSTMNWWSAYSWCQGMGGRMPSIAELCPGQPMTNGTACGRTYARHTWTATPVNGSTVWTISWSDGKSLNGTDGSKNKTDANTYCLKSSGTNNAN